MLSNKSLEHSYTLSSYLYISLEKFTSPLSTLKKEYLLLAPVDDEESEDMFAFRVDKKDGKEEYNLVENDEELQAIKKEYKKLLY